MKLPRFWALALKEEASKSVKKPKPKLLENPLALTTVYTPDDPHKIDIIFTHGLGGGSRKTWSHDPCDYSTFWPGEWLPQEEDLGFKEARIHTFGYNANYNGPVTSLAILDFGRDFIQTLWGSPLNFGDVPIILVGHSMGGLVSKKAYILAISNPQDYSRISNAIKGMLFLGTPHRGSSHSKLLNNILRMAPKRGPQQYVNDLNISSITIRTIDELFKGVMDDLILASLYETIPLKMGPIEKMIVEPKNAVIGVPTELVRPVDANHRTICKFSSRQDPNYIAVRNVLSWMVLSVLADGERKNWVDPLEIPPFRGGNKQEEAEGSNEGKGKEAEGSNEGKSKEAEGSNEGKSKEAEGSNEGKSKEAEGSNEGKGKEAEGSNEGKGKEAEGSNEGKGKEAEGSGKEAEGSNEGKGKEAEGSNEGKGKEAEGSNEGKGKEAEGSNEGKGKEADKGKVESRAEVVNTEGIVTGMGMSTSRSGLTLVQAEGSESARASSRSSLVDVSDTGGETTIVLPLGVPGPSRHAHADVDMSSPVSASSIYPHSPFKEDVPVGDSLPQNNLPRLTFEEEMTYAKTISFCDDPGTPTATASC
ncbi:hypothetical protein BDZ91DRAFT_712118 [Kalaharituber pfeilii]|nr:hypothetical protein BDZ91DRAFT_712118 [Kalaharituber pfeilii]